MPPTSPPTAPEIVVADNLAILSEMAAVRIRRAAAAAIAARGRFRIALAGGSTPRALYPRLIQGIDWTRADLFFGDERAVPPDDPRSNYRMARETLLDPAAIPAANVFRWRAEDPDLDAAARDYERALTAPGAPPSWIWRSSASAPMVTRRPCSRAPPRSPRRRGWRSPSRSPPSARGGSLLTYPALLGAHEITFLVAGREKSSALAAVLAPRSGLPAARIVHRAGRVTIFCDREAASAAPPRATSEREEVP